MFFPTREYAPSIKVWATVLKVSLYIRDCEYMDRDTILLTPTQHVTHVSLFGLARQPFATDHLGSFLNKVK